MLSERRGGYGLLVFPSDCGPIRSALASPIHLIKHNWHYYFGTHFPFFSVSLVLRQGRENCSFLIFVPWLEGVNEVSMTFR